MIFSYIGSETESCINIYKKNSSSNGENQICQSWRENWKRIFGFTYLLTTSKFFFVFYLREIGVFTLAILPTVCLGFAASCTSTSPILMKMVAFLKLPDVLISVGKKICSLSRENCTQSAGKLSDKAMITQSMISMDWKELAASWPTQQISIICIRSKTKANSSTGVCLWSTGYYCKFSVYYSMLGVWQD